jgi:hypothetical protein
VSKPLYDVIYQGEDIPSDERCQNTEGATSSKETSVCGTSATVHQVCEAKHEECEVKREEEQKEGNGRAKGADQQQEGEDEPCHEIESERVEEWLWRFCLQCRRDLEAIGCQNDNCADPETTVRRESSGTEGVSESNFPIVR